MFWFIECAGVIGCQVSELNERVAFTTSEKQL